MKKILGPAGWRGFLLDLLFILLGTVLVGLPIAVFTVPNDIAPGGVSGLATALAHLTPHISVGAWALLYNKLLLTAVNPALAQSRRVNTKWIEYAFAALLAVAVMLSIKWVGVLLINALLILPAAAARNVARTARQHALFSVLIGLFCGVAGLILAYYLDTGVGAAVVLCAALCYAVTLPLRARVR